MDGTWTYNLKSSKSQCTVPPAPHRPVWKAGAARALQRRPKSSRLWSPQALHTVPLTTWTADSVPEHCRVKRSGHRVQQQGLEADHRGQVHTEGALGLPPHFVVRAPPVHLDGLELQEL